MEGGGLWREGFKEKVYLLTLSLEWNRVWTMTVMMGEMSLDNSVEESEKKNYQD